MKNKTTIQSFSQKTIVWRKKFANEYVNYFQFQEDKYMNVVLNIFLIKRNYLNFFLWVFWSKGFRPKYVFCLKSLLTIVKNQNDIPLITKRQIKIKNRLLHFLFLWKRSSSRTIIFKNDRFVFRCFFVTNKTKRSFIKK